MELPRFYGSDSPTRFATNLDKLGKIWPWWNRSVQYTVNSQGYRCSEFDQVDWSQSILCFGCSITFGVGVDDSDTWPSQLSLITGIPTVNLGIAGGSIQINWANSVRLIAAGIRPRGVVYYWPDKSRHCEFQPDGSVVDHWNSREKPVFDPGCRGSLNTAWALMPHHNTAVSQLMINSLVWPCARLDLTWSRQNLDSVTVINYAKDLGRDMIHPGPLSHRALAETMAADLKI